MDNELIYYKITRHGKTGYLAISDKSVLRALGAECELEVITQDAFLDATVPADLDKGPLTYPGGELVNKRFGYTDDPLPGFNDAKRQGGLPEQLLNERNFERPGVTGTAYTLKKKKQFGEKVIIEKP